MGGGDRIFQWQELNGFHEGYKDITPINCHNGLLCTYRNLRVAPNSSLQYGIFDNPYLPSTCEQKHANIFYCDGFSLIQKVDGRCIMYHVISGKNYLEMNQKNPY